jgi:hypothetical protein
LDSRLQLYIEGPIEVSNDDTILQILITLDYAMELYTLGHIDYPRAHTSHYLCLCLVKYPKLLLCSHLSLSSYYITLINTSVFIILLAHSLLLHYITITNHLDSLDLGL